MRTRNPMRIGNAGRAITFLIIIVTTSVGVLAFAGGCFKNQKDTAGKTNPLYGTWENLGRPKEQPVVTFNENGTYVLEFLGYNLHYNGNFSLSGNTMRMVDFYCGKAVPGVYEFQVKGDELSFRVLDDPKCDRSRFFPLKWKRQR